MKRILAALLAFTLLVCGALTLTSCAPKPELDLKDAKDNLEDEKYDYVSHTDDKDDLDVNIEEELYAREKSNNDDDGNYISIVVYKDTKSAKLAYKALKMSHESEIDQLKLSIKALKHELKKYEDDLDSDEVKILEKTLKNREDRLEWFKDEFVVGRSGKTVWYGTKDAIKDSKGK